jgi:predicted Zn-dependent peptidase
MPFHQHTLPNGLQLIGETSPSARSTALGFFVRTGARDETQEVSGVTHFLEHMIFKGTERRSADAVNRDFSRIGADSNAWTNEENTVFHAAFLPEYLPQAVDILADILRPSLRVVDFDMEKKVILEEIARAEDEPGSATYERARRLYFGGHGLGNSVLGTPQSIAALTRDQMHAYFSRRYVAPNITAVAAGHLEWPRFVALIEKHCGAWAAGPAPRAGLAEVAGSGGFQVVARDKVAQEYVLLMGAGPPAESPLRYAATLLSMAVGDDSGSRLYWSLVDPGLAEAADCSFSECDGTGVFYSMFTSEPEQAEENLAVLHEVLGEVQRDGVAAEELEQARNKALSRLVRGSERPRGRMSALGINWTYQHQYRSVDDELKAFSEVTLGSVREVLDRYPLDRVTTLALGPLKELAQSANGRK